MAKRKVDPEEFKDVFGAYCRVDAGGALIDTRDAVARKLAERTAVEIVRFDMEPCDVAAIFSGCVRVAMNDSLMQVKALTAEKLQKRLTDLAETKRLPLAVMPGHPAECLFISLLSSSDGCVLYRDIALALEGAAEDEEIRPHLYGFEAPAAAAASQDDAEADEPDDVDDDGFGLSLEDDADEDDDMEEV